MGWFTTGLVRPSNGGDNWATGMAHDIGYQSTNPRGVMTGGSNFWNQGDSQHRWLGDKNDASTAAFNARTKQQIDSRDALLAGRTRLLDGYRSEDDAARGRALGAVESGYGNRQGAYDDAYNANLKSALTGLGQQYQQGSQQAALQNAKRGRTGSSYDAETQAGLQDRYRSGAMNAANDAYGYSQQLSDADMAQHQALRRAILSGDPQSGAAYQAQAAGANNQSAALAGMSALDQRQRQVNELYGNAQSQQLGGYGNAGANYVYATQGQYGRGY